MLIIVTHDLHTTKLNAPTFLRKTPLQLRTENFGIVLVIFINCGFNFSDERLYWQYFSMNRKYREQHWVKQVACDHYKQKLTTTTMKTLILAFYYPSILPWKLNLRIFPPSWITILWQKCFFMLSIERLHLQATVAMAISLINQQCSLAPKESLKFKFNVIYELTDIEAYFSKDTYLMNPLTRWFSVY